MVGHKAAEGLQPSGKVVGCHEVRAVGPRLVMGVGVEALYGLLFNRAVHPFDRRRPV